jgi:hypothetical protein
MKKPRLTDEQKAAMEADINAILERCKQEDGEYDIKRFAKLCRAAGYNVDIKEPSN